MTDQVRRYLELTAVLKALDVSDPRYDATADEMDPIWLKLGEAEREELEGILIAMNEAERTGEGSPLGEARGLGGKDGSS